MALPCPILINFPAAKARWIIRRDVVSEIPMARDNLGTEKSQLANWTLISDSFLVEDSIETPR